MTDKIRSPGSMKVNACMRDGRARLDCPIRERESERCYAGWVEVERRALRCCWQWSKYPAMSHLSSLSPNNTLCLYSSSSVLSDVENPTDQCAEVKRGSRQWNMIFHQWYGFRERKQLIHNFKDIVHISSGTFFS